jgi:predicted metal-dependent phosphoesterase TrpH
MPVHRIETHAHTNLVSPCGRLTPEELVAAYADAGYSALVVTDHLVSTLPIFRRAASWRERVHRFFSGYSAAREAARGTRLRVLPGFELTFDQLPGRDFLVYGIDEELLMDLPDLTALDPVALKPLADAAGAVVVQAHPFRRARPIDPVLLDGVEVFNGNLRHDSADELAAAFAREHDLLAISGSDAHQWEDICRGGITLPHVPSSTSDLARMCRDAKDEVGLLVADPAS